MFSLFFAVSLAMSVYVDDQAIHVSEASDRDPIVVDAGRGRTTIRDLGPAFESEAIEVGTSSTRTGTSYSRYDTRTSYATSYGRPIQRSYDLTVCCFRPSFGSVTTWRAGVCWPFVLCSRTPLRWTQADRELLWKMLAMQSLLVKTGPQVDTTGGLYEPTKRCVHGLSI